MANENILTASYEAMRMNILASYIQNPVHFNSAYVYAWLHRMPAVGIAAHESVFWRADTLAIDRVAIAHVEEVIGKLVAKGHLETLAYDRLATKPGIVDNERHLVTILGYFSLKGDYSLEVKRALRVNMPSDKELVTSFGPEMITFPS